MRHISEVLRVAAQVLSQHQVSRSVGVNRTTVPNYLERAERAGVSWPLAESLAPRRSRRGCSSGPMTCVGPMVNTRPEVHLQSRHDTQSVRAWLEVRARAQAWRAGHLQVLWLEYCQAHTDGGAIRGAVCITVVGSGETVEHESKVSDGVRWPTCRPAVLF
jgi:hypothetical protein